MIPVEECDRLISAAEKILAMLNAFIKFVAKSQKVKTKSITP